MFFLQKKKINTIFWFWFYLIFMMRVSSWYLSDMTNPLRDTHDLQPGKSREENWTQDFGWAKSKPYANYPTPVDKYILIKHIWEFIQAIEEETKGCLFFFFLYPCKYSPTQYKSLPSHWHYSQGNSGLFWSKRVDQLKLQVKWGYTYSHSTEFEGGSIRISWYASHSDLCDMFYEQGKPQCR